MRTLDDHIVNPANDQLIITVMDEAGQGNAHHHYMISGFDTSTNPSGVGTEVELVFQNGPINEVGVNGITHEALMAVLADRLRGFQSGPFACRENALALTKLEESLHWLQQRTIRRMRAGVEGTHAMAKGDGSTK